MYVNIFLKFHHIINRIRTTFRSRLIRHAYDVTQVERTAARRTYCYLIKIGWSVAQGQGHEGVGMKSVIS